MGHKYVKEDEVFTTSRNGVVPKPTSQEVSDGKVLKSDGTWGVGGSQGASNFSDLEDVNFSNLQNGQVPKYNSQTHKWENEDESGGTVTDVEYDGTSVVDPQTGVASIPAAPTPNYPVTDVEVNGQSVVQNKVAKITSYKELTLEEYIALDNTKNSNGVAYFIKNVGTLFGNILLYDGYAEFGEILTGKTDPIRGIGQFTAICIGGIAIIDFTVKVTVAGSDLNDFEWGIYANTLKTLVPSLPNIRPSVGGTWKTSVTSTSPYDFEGYGTLFETEGERWAFSRRYNTTGNTGVWGAGSISANTKLWGTLYGTY